MINFLSYCFSFIAVKRHHEYSNFYNGKGLIGPRLQFQRFGPLSVSSVALGLVGRQHIIMESANRMAQSCLSRGSQEANKEKGLLGPKVLSMGLAPMTSLPIGSTY